MSVSRRALFALVPLAFAGSATMALAATMSFNVPLTGAQQVPPVDTPGSGTAHLTYDPATRVVTWSITYSKLSSPVTMAHFHDGPEGKNGPVVIWLSTKGKAPMSPIKGKATLTPDQAQEFLAGDWYINVHSKDHPAGEIRGQVMPPKT
ncbi:MAG TPA: CHRD domain-containing protein [Acetobacteraceae bacterium]|nr:CHRD domain-containing protein [Acetobacteraceae bacterium]